MKRILTAAALSAGLAAPAFAEMATYELDASHSQIVIAYTHAGFSTTYGLISGFGGTIQFDADAPDTSSVEVSFPLTMLDTGWAKRDEHIMSPDFFGADDSTQVMFKSTGIEVTGETTGKIMGDLTIGETTIPVTLDASLNKAGDNRGKEWIGFDAETTILRSDAGVGKYAPVVGDEVKLMISIEAAKK